VITDNGSNFALNRAGGNATGVLIISGTSNNYGGGTNVLGGSLQVTGKSGTPLGLGLFQVVGPGTSAGRVAHCWQ
jgi:autotransporter-associated beta strand protein